MSETGAANRTPSPLTAQIQVLTRDLEWTLAHFAFVADVTALSSECDVAHSPSMSVASCRSLPFNALAFLGESPELLSNYAAFLVDVDSEAYFLVNETQRMVVQQAFPVIEEIPEWQMVFREDPARLNPAPAVALRIKDLPAMRALAEAGGLLALEKEPFTQGPAFGVWEDGKLVSMGTTHLRVPGAAEIGNLVTLEGYRRRGYGTAVVSALIRALHAEGLGIFLQVYQSNTAAVRLYEHLGFQRIRPMYLMRCIIRNRQETPAKE